MTMEERTLDVDTWAKAIGLKVDSQYVGTTKKDGWKCFHWGIKLTMSEKLYVTNYYMGRAHNKNGNPVKPELSDILETLAMDCMAGEHLLFEDFAHEYGYDSDSRKAEKIWRQCQEARGKLMKFFDEHFEVFLTCRDNEVNIDGKG